MEELTLNIEGIPPPPKTAGTLVKKQQSSLQKEIRILKAAKAKEIQDNIQSLLEQTTKILKHITQGNHYHPDDDMEAPETTWLAGRGGKGLKTLKGTLAKVALVGLYPGKHEIRHKPSPAVMVGPSGKFLDKTLFYCFEDDLNCLYRTNLVKYFKTPKSKISAVEKAVGKAILFKELQAKNIEYVICLGTEVYDALCADKTRFPASKFRGTFLPKNKARIPVYLAGLQNPAHIISPEGQKDTQAFEDALRNLFEYIIKGEQQFDLPEFTNIETGTQTSQWLAELQEFHAETKKQGRETVLAIDTETITTSTNGNLEPTELILITTSYGTDKAVHHKELKTHVWTFLKTPEWTYQNGVTNNTFQDEFILEDLEEEPEDGNPPKESKRLNRVYDSRLPEEKYVAHELKTQNLKGKDTASLDKADIKKTKLCSSYSRKLCNAIISEAIKTVDQVILQHGHFDKQALEKGIGINWNELVFNENGEISPKFKELMIETLILNENDSRKLKDIVTNALGWKRYEMPLEFFKAEHDITAYELIPWNKLAPYGAADAAGTLLAANKKKKDRLQKWRVNQNNLKKYNTDIKALTNQNHFDFQRFNPETLTTTLNQLMTPLYNIKKTGMPVGKKGMEKVRQLIDFYSTHYEKLRKKVAEKSKNVTGHELTDPGSIDQVNFILYGPKMKGGLELEPFKEPGKGGRLWADLSEEERKKVRGSGAIDGESFTVLTEKIDNPSTKDFVKCLGECRQIKSLMDNFFADPNDKDTGFFSRITPDLRLHTEYMPTTDTLRFRSQPNLANPPKKESGWVKEILGEAPPWELRNCITAEDGHLLPCRDWSSAEVYTLMYRSNDPAGLDAIQKGLDFHIRIGLTINKVLQNAFQSWKNKTPELVTTIKLSTAKAKAKNPKKGAALEEYLFKLYYSTNEKDAHKLLKALFGEIRDKIKPVTFGVPYGQTAEALARVNKMPVEEAHLNIQGYHDTYQAASKYLDYNGTFAINYRMLPTPWGYIRNFNPRQPDGDIKRQGFNLQLQHGVAGMMNQTLIEWEQIKRKYNLKSNVFLSLYDAIGWHTPEKEAQTIAEISHEIMTLKRPVGPNDNHTIPTEGTFTHYWEGPKADIFFPDLNLLKN
jgi:DNA polymerase I-like protein with 3'-5' exonuclease and polymerase domains/uracil-DNA glycosylase